LGCYYLCPNTSAKAINSRVWIRNEFCAINRGCTVTLAKEWPRFRKAVLARAEVKASTDTELKAILDTFDQEKDKYDEGQHTT
jgi:hypothetical protein